MMRSSRSIPEFPPQIRPFQARRDLSSVADLIELCFSDTLTADGLRYIQQMRQEARQQWSIQWGLPWHDYASIPPAGFVWEQKGKMVGNVTILPFYAPKGVEYLIANVAVHPDFRQQGIGKLLTQRALYYIHQKGAKVAWLHVRDDNPIAIHLYTELGFQERMRRTSWHYPALDDAQASPPLRAVSFLPSPGVTISPRAASEWHQHQIWLSNTYPEQYSWHLSFHKGCFKPGLLGWFMSSWNNTQLRHWSVYLDGKLSGVVSLEFTAERKRILWLALDPLHEQDVAYAAGSFILRTLPNKSKIFLDYPAYQAVAPLEALGFTAEQTLIWMSRDTLLPPKTL
ncbi:MAG: GNAT family N-acetyltransferase [Chloroflexota bacterium]